MKNTILLAHGGGGRLTRDLIKQEIASRFNLGELPDAALVCPPSGSSLLFTTDGFVVQPIFFPGGDIGRLAVYGTVNDLAVSGAEPLWLSCTLILEEGLKIDTLRRVLDGMKEAAQSCGVKIVTGDTKVVPHGQCDGIYISTSGIGRRIEGFDITAKRLQPGDEVLISGPVGDHGMAVLAARNAAPVSATLSSDAGSVHKLVLSLQDIAPRIKFMRDPTRGGLASVANELVDGRPIGLELEDASIPRSAGSAALSELLGIDLLHLASEGRVVAVCGAGAGELVLKRWRGLAEGKEAALIGRVNNQAGKAVLVTTAGGRRLIDIPEGELLPRIC